jgi:ArsR family metal-binding transcriptional regulator
MSFLNAIVLIRTLPCLAEPGKIIIIGQPDRSLGDVIPYLATLPSVIAYNPENLTLTFRRQPGFMTLYPEMVYITQIKNIEEGLVLLEALVKAINATWENRAELVACTTVQRAPRWLDIIMLLPRTNCKRCGEVTCMAFAASLVKQERQLQQCVPLASDPAFSDRRATLDAILRWRSPKVSNYSD